MDTDAELLLDTLCEAWHSASRQVQQQKQMQHYWMGVANGLACAVATVSGIPDNIGFMDTVRAGTDIARLRSSRT